MKKIMLATVLMINACSPSYAQEGTDLNSLVGACVDAEMASDVIYYDSSIQTLGYKEFDTGNTDDYYKQGDKFFVASFNVETWMVCFDTIDNPSIPRTLIQYESE